MPTANPTQVPSSPPSRLPSSSPVVSPTESPTDDCLVFIVGSDCVDVNGTYDGCQYDVYVINLFYFQFKFSAR